MDGEFFWVVMLVLYLIFQVLGGRKKAKRKAQQRRAESADGRLAEMPPQRRTGATSESPGRSAELDEALVEIRRALGFPETSERRTETGTPAEARHDGNGGPSQAPSEITGHEAARTREAETTPPRVRPTIKTTRLQTTPQTPTRIPARTSLRYTSPIPGSIGDRTRDQRITAVTLSERTDKGKPSAGGVEDPRVVSSRAHAVRARLRSPESLKEAFLLKEILDPPRSMRRLR